MKDRTEQHLTDDELPEWLDGSAGPAVQTHLDGCAACRSEAHGLQDGICALRHRDAAAGGGAQSARMAEGLAPARRMQLRMQHRLRWVGAGVLALLLAAQTAWMMKTRPAPASAAQAVAHPAAAAIPQPAAALGNDSMSDDELLQAVNNDLATRCRRRWLRWARLPRRATESPARKNARVKLRP